jgi:hypothetical protein
METKTLRQTRQQTVIDTFIKENGATLEQFHALKFLRYSLVLSAPHYAWCIAAFRRNAPNPYAHYRYDTHEQRESWINDQKKMEQSSFENLERWHQRGIEEARSIIPGSILYSSWGYEQTNIDFYQVISRKGDFVMLQEIGKHKTFAHFADRNWDDRGSCTANPTAKIGEPMRKKINKHGAITLTTYSSARPWNGQPLDWSSYA